MWMDWEYFKADASQYLIQIRTLIKQLKEYGVDEDTLFHVDDLLYSNNIPKVARCLKQVAIIVSINKDNGQKAWPRQIPRYWHMSAAIYVVLSRTKLITTLAINFLNSGSKWCSEKLIAKRIFWEVIGCEIRVRHGETECWIKSLLSRVMPSFVCHVTGAPAGLSRQHRITVTVPPPGHHTHVWPLPLLITSDTYKSNAAPLRETRDGREEQWFITIVSFWCSSSTVWRILYIQLLWTFIEHSGRSDPPLRAAYLRCINVTRSKRLWLSSTGPEMILDPHDAMTRTRGPAPGCLHSAGREQGSALVTDIWLQTLYSATYSSHQSALTKLQPRC